MQTLNYRLLLVFSFILITISKPSNAQKRNNPILVIFDTDMGNDIDDVLALDMLYKYSDQEKVKLLGIMNNKGSKDATHLIDLLNTWYGYGKVPIGRIDNGVKIDDYVDYGAKMIAMNDSINLYKYSVKNHDKLLPAAELYRKILSKQADSSVVIISVGFSTNLAKLLNSNADKYSKLKGTALVSKKVRLLSIMAGSFGPKKRAEFNVIHDIPSAQYVINNWPSKLVLSPFEIGKEVIYPSSSIEKDFQWTAHHPLVDAYKRYRPYPYDRPTWDLTSVYYAVNPSTTIFKKSSPGQLTINDKGFTFFEEKPNGKHVVLSLPKENKELLKNYFIDLIGRKPKNK